jgi:hypothetical protein
MLQKASKTKQKTKAGSTNIITQRDKKKSASVARQFFCRGDTRHVVFVANSEAANIVLKTGLWGGKNQSPHVTPRVWFG